MSLMMTLKSGCVLHVVNHLITVERENNGHVVSQSLANVVLMCCVLDLTVQ